MNVETKSDGAGLAQVMFRTLIRGRIGEKERARQFICKEENGVDLSRLRELLIDGIRGDFAPGQEDERQDDSIKSVRSWLVGILALISEGDEAATAAAVPHVDRKIEPFYWARFWTLEGLIRCKSSEMKSVATKVWNDDEDLLVSMLASAWLAEGGDKQALDRVRSGLSDANKVWYVLRALRIVPIAATVPKLCEIVKNQTYGDSAYDAIMALGAVPSDWNQATAAAKTLYDAIDSMRGASWKDGLRVGAIIGLGKLRVSDFVPLLLDELTDDNPGVVRVAVRATVQVLGVGPAVVRIVESAAKSDENGVIALGRALRWLDREAVATELETLMSTGQDSQQNAARLLLSELGGAVAFQKLRARTDVMHQYADVLEKAEEKIQELFESSVREAQSGFQIAVYMDVTVFILGILLLLGSAVLALRNQGSLSAWVGIGVTGGVGTLGVIYSLLIGNPRKQVRESVDHLMRMKLIFLSYLRRLHQTDQAFARRLLEEKSISIDEMVHYTSAVGSIMEDTLKQSPQNHKD